MKFQNPSMQGSEVCYASKSITYRRMNLKQLCPSNFFEVGGINISKYPLMKILPRVLRIVKSDHD